MPPIKKIVTWIIVIFLLYAILTHPNTAADIVGSAWDIVWSSIQNVFIFFDRVMRG